MTPPTPPPPDRHKRMTLSDVVERMTERGGATSTASLKTMSTGTLVGRPAADVSIAAGTSWDDVKVMTQQAGWAYAELLANTIGATVELPAGAGEPPARPPAAKGAK